jgi:hypothetical protein
MHIIFSTCWYLFKAKFDSSVYQQWIYNMLSNVNNYYLVIYTDEASKSFVIPYESNPRIKIIIKPMETFYNYKYREQWIHNHSMNHSLKQDIDWRVNMLWSEKINFVEETIREKYIDINSIKTVYGWCDIGYFRGRNNDMTIDDLNMWPNKDKINVDISKIHYGCVHNNTHYVNHIFQLVNNKNANGLPVQQLPSDLNTIGGGFFMIDESMIEWWKNTYDRTLNLYFDNGYLVKDDQTIITDCIFSNMTKFYIHNEPNNNYDSWFLFQRLLL